LSNVQGNVQIDRRTGDGFEAALENLPVLQGTRIATKEDGRAEIEFEDGSTIRLAPNTSIEFTRLSLHDSGGKNTELEVSEGTAYFNINPGKRDDFMVDVGHRSVNLDHAARFRVTVDSSKARVAVSHGQVDLSAPGSDLVSVSKGKTASFDVFNQDNYNVAHEYEEGPYDSWNDDLDSYHAHNFRHTTGEMPYGYGSSDLNYYGSYISDPGVGSCWRPYFAGYGCTPFLTARGSGTQDSAIPGCRRIPGDGHRIDTGAGISRSRLGGAGNRGCGPIGSRCQGSDGHPWAGSPLCLRQAVEDASHGSTRVQ
jgi:hypothetical protein